MTYRAIELLVILALGMTIPWALLFQMDEVIHWRLDHDQLLDFA